MLDVKFDEDKTDPSFLYGRFEPSKKEPAIVSWLIRKKIAKNEVVANIILLAVFFVCIIISIFLIFRKPSYKPLPPGFERIELPTKIPQTIGNQ
jgi:hypothetical protein